MNNNNEQKTYIHERILFENLLKKISFDIN